VATVNAINAVIAEVVILIIAVAIVLLSSLAQVNSIVLSYVKHQDAPNVA
jgi:hypothetical protein